MLFFEISVKLLFFFSGLESGYGCDGGTRRQTRSSNKAYLHTTTVESSGITVTSFKLYCSSQSLRIEFAPVYLNCLLPFVFPFLLHWSISGRFTTAPCFFFSQKSVYRGSSRSTGSVREWADPSGSVPSQRTLTPLPPFLAATHSHPTLWLLYILTWKDNNKDTTGLYSM